MSKYNYYEIKGFDRSLPEDVNAPIEAIIKDECSGNERLLASMEAKFAFIRQKHVYGDLSVSFPKDDLRPRRKYRCEKIECGVIKNTIKDIFEIHGDSEVMFSRIIKNSNVSCKKAEKATKMEDK
jgi:hypothetical protein